MKRLFTWIFTGLCIAFAFLSGGSYLVYTVALCVEYYHRHGMSLGFVVFCIFSGLFAFVLPFVDGIRDGMWLAVIGIYGSLVAYIVSTFIASSLGAASEKRKSKA